MDTVRKSFYDYVWKLHFYMGLYAVPFLLMLSISGLIMMFSIQIEGRYGEKMEIVPNGKMLSIEKQKNEILKEYGDVKILEYIIPLNEKSVSTFLIKQSGKKHLITLNPYTAKILKNIERNKSYYRWFSILHGSLFIGDFGDRLIEISSSFALLLLFSGIYLMLYNKKSCWKVFKIDMRLKGRNLWKNIHETLGVYMSILLIVFLLTGLGWAGIWGGKFVQVWSSTVFPEGKWDTKPSSTLTHGSLSSDVSWGLELTPLPTSNITNKNKNIDADDIYDFAKKNRFDGRFHIFFPNGEKGIWSISQDSMSSDMKDPRKDRTVHIDRYSGKVIGDLTYYDYSLLAKAVAFGVAFHNGNMGALNIILNTLLCLSLVIISFSGVLMWWQRHKSSNRYINVSILPKDIKLDKIFITIFITLAIFFPMAGLGLLIIMLLDFLVFSRVEFLKKFFS